MRRRAPPRTARSRAPRSVIATVRERPLDERRQRRLRRCRDQRVHGDQRLRIGARSQVTGQAALRACTFGCCERPLGFEIDERALAAHPIVGGSLATFFAAPRWRNMTVLSSCCVRRVSSDLPGRLTLGRRAGSEERTGFLRARTAIATNRDGEQRALRRR